MQASATTVGSIPDKRPYREILVWVALTAVLLAIFSLIHAASPLLFGVDGYFHIKYSQLLRTEGLIRDLPWLAFTIHSRDYADDHFLFHALQTPFTFGDLRTGAKLYATIVASAVFLLFYRILNRQGLRFPLLWTAGMLVSAEPFLVRLCMARAPGVSLLFLLVGTELILRRKDRWIAPLAFLYVWLYGGFPLLGVLVGIAFGVSLIVEKKPRWTLLVACGLGTAAGLVIHPYFPDNIRFLYTSYTQVELGTFPDIVKAGSEDYPYASSSAVRNAMLVWALLFGVVLLYLVRPFALTPDTLTLFLFSTVLLCLYLNVRRFIEYWPPFAFLFAAFALNPFLKEISLSRLRGIRRYAPAAILTLLLVAAGYDTFAELFADQAASTDYRHYRGAAAYLQRHTPKDSLVFTANWADFPFLFHFNTHNRYIVGLGLHYLYLFDDRLYSHWIKIVEGKDPRPAQSVLKQFGAQFIFSLKDERDFLKALDTDPDARIVYEDENARVYRIEGKLKMQN